MFIVDHFWNVSFPSSSHGSGLSPRPTDHHTGGGSSSKGTPKNSQDANENQHVDIEFFQEQLFTMFSKGNDPLLSLVDCERLMTECFKFLMQKNKIKKHISKRTLKKVVFRSCHGLLLRGLIGLHDRIQLDAATPVARLSEQMNMPRQSTNLAHQQNYQENNDNQVSFQNSKQKRLNYYCEDYSIPRKPTQNESSLSMCRQLEVRLMVERLNSSIGHIQKRVSFNTLSKNRFYLHQQQHLPQSQVFDYGPNLVKEVDQELDQKYISSHRRYKSKYENAKPIMSEEPHYGSQNFGSSQNHYASQDNHARMESNCEYGSQNNVQMTTMEYSQSHGRPMSQPGYHHEYHSTATDTTLIPRPCEGRIVSKVPSKLETMNSDTAADPSNMNYQQMADDTILDNMRCLRQIETRISSLKNSSQGSHSPKPSQNYVNQNQQYAQSLQYSQAARDDEESPQIYCGEEPVYDEEEQPYGEEEHAYGEGEQVYQNEEEYVYDDDQPAQISYQNYMVSSQSGRTPSARYPLISPENHQPVSGDLYNMRPHYDSNLVITQQQQQQNIVSDTLLISEQHKYLQEDSLGSPSDQMKIIVEDSDQHMHLASAELTSSMATSDMAPPPSHQLQQRVSNMMSSSDATSDVRHSAGYTRLSTLQLIEKRSGQYSKNDPIDSQQSLFHQAQSVSIQQQQYPEQQQIQYLTRPLCYRESSRASMQFGAFQAQKMPFCEEQVYVSTTQDENTQYPQTQQSSFLANQDNNLEQKQQEQTQQMNQRISTGADVLSTDPLTSDGEHLMSSQSRDRQTESTGQHLMRIEERHGSKDGRKKRKKNKQQDEAACIGSCQNALLYERKYRKAKQKARGLIKEKEEEEGRSQRLVSLNTDLTQRNEDMDNHVLQATQALELAQQEQERLIDVQKMTSMQYAFLNIARIRTKTDFLEEQANLNRSFNDWKDQAYVSKVEKFYQSEIFAIKRWVGVKELFSQWKLNSTLKAKQEESKMLRKVVLERLLTKNTYRAKQRVFRVWQGPLLNSPYIKGMKHDFYKVVDSLKIMRSALFVEKLKSLQQKYHTRHVQFGFSGLSNHAQSMNQLEVLREQMTTSLAMHNQSQLATFSGHQQSKQQHYLSHQRVQSSASRRRPADILMNSITHNKQKSTSPVVSEVQKRKKSIARNKRYQEESEADLSREYMHPQNTSTDFVVEGSFKDLSRQKQKILRQQEYEFQKQKVLHGDDDEEETPTEASDDMVLSSQSAGKRQRYTFRVRQLRNQSSYIEAFTKLYSLENKFSNALDTNAKSAYFEQWKAVTFEEEEDVSQTNYNYNGELANYAANKSQFTENEKSQAFDTFNSGINHSSHQSTSFRSQSNPQFERPPKPFKGQNRRVKPMVQIDQTHYQQQQLQQQQQQQQYQLPVPQAQSMHDTTQDSELYYQHQHPQISAIEEYPSQHFDRQKRAVTPQNVPHRYQGPQVKHVGSVRHLYSSKAQQSMFQLGRVPSKVNQIETEIVTGGGKITNTRLNSGLNSAGNISQPAGIGTNSNGSRSSASTKVISILGAQRQPFTFLQQTANGATQQTKHKNQHKKSKQFAQKRAL